MTQTLNKHQLIIRDIATVYLPEYASRRTEMMTYWKHYNVEHIVEDAMCRVGGYEFVDEHSYDNTDYSDTKTASISSHDSIAVVGNILTPNQQKPKVGDLRVVVYNPYKERLDYYFFDKAGWEDIREWGQANRGRLRASYNSDLDTIVKWQRFRVKDFETLAKMPSTVTDPNSYQTANTPKNTLFDWNPPAGLFDPA
jgi:hypothetical protein